MADRERFDAHLAVIRNDRTHGAAELAAMALDAMAAACRDWAGMTAAERRKRLDQLVGQVRGLRPSMAALTNWAIAFHDRMAPNAASPDWPAQAARTARALRDRQTAFRIAQVDAARDRLAGARHVLTLSYSSTVTHLLTHAPAAECAVTVAESRPLLEGRRTATALHQAGRPVRLITDAQIGQIMADIDCVLIGADTVCRDRAAVNKVGSYPAALAAREAGVPLLVAADSFKIDPSVDSEHVTLEAMPGSEIWPEQPALCRNVYFEPVPAALIACYITEIGMLPPAGLAAAIDGWAGRYRALGLMP